MTKVYLRQMTILLVSIICSSVPALAAGDASTRQQLGSISIGSEFASGRYGTDSTTSSVYSPLILTWFPTDRIDVGIELPFIYQSSSYVTTDIYRNSQASTAAKIVARGGPGGSGGRGVTIMQQQSGSGSVSSESSGSSVSGIGDIILKFGVIALFEENNLPLIRPSVFVKFPTANSSDGLGTGQLDAGIGVEGSKWFGDTHLLGEIFYTYQGDAEGFELQDYLSFTLGAGYQLTAQFKPMLQFKGATAPSKYSDPLLEMRARGVWFITGTTALDLYVSRGLSDSSPDYGAGISVIYSF